jgi:DNA-binding MarR family transcriptional regulator
MTDNISTVTTQQEDLATDFARTLGCLDEVIHQKVRMGIMTAVLSMSECDFRFLKDTLGVTDGNLSIHIAKLEEAGYLEVRKEFVRRKPHTSYLATPAGRKAFQSYIGVLERIIATAGHT